MLLMVRVISFSRWRGPRRYAFMLQVPQAYAAFLRIGMEASFTLPEFPGRTFQAHVTNTGWHGRSNLPVAPNRTSNPK